MKNPQQYSCNVHAVYANRDFIALIFETYHKKNNELKNRDTFRISKSEVPAQIIEMLEKSPKTDEVDISDFIKEELENFKTLNKNSKTISSLGYFSDNEWIKTGTTREISYDELLPNVRKRIKAVGQQKFIEHIREFIFNDINEIKNSNPQYDWKASYAWEVLAIKSNDDTITLKCNFYYKQDDNWIENSRNFQVLKSEVPDQIIEMIEKSPKNEGVDISDFIEDELTKFETLNQNSKEE